MIIILLTPNVYCLENIDSSESDSTDNSHTDSSSSNEKSVDSVDMEYASEIILESESENIEAEISQIETLISSISVPTEDPGFLVESATSRTNDIWIMQDYPELIFALPQPTFSNPWGFNSIESYDGFGQLIQNKYEVESDWIIQNTTYNELGLVSSTEVPHYLNESGLSITYEYDPIGRPTVITNTDNTTLRYHYELENTTITNQNGVNKTLTSDIFGNIVKVYEFNEGETYATSYVYDALNNLVEVIPSSSNVPGSTLPPMFTSPTIHLAEKWQ